MRPFKIKTATPSDAKTVIQTMTRAFSADPVARWFYPDSEHYEQHFPSFVGAFAGAAFEHGSADCLEDYSAAAFWFPPGARADDQALAMLLRDSIPERRHAEVLALLEQMEHNHPAEPHWYLPMIGVRPAKQGRGYGSALLEHGLKRCDADNKLAYLESSSPRNIPLYERHGFELLVRFKRVPRRRCFRCFEGLAFPAGALRQKGVFQSLADFQWQSSGSTGG